MAIVTSSLTSSFLNLHLEKPIQEDSRCQLLHRLRALQRALSHCGQMDIGPLMSADYLEFNNLDQQKICLRRLRALKDHFDDNTLKEMLEREEKKESLEHILRSFYPECFSDIIPQNFTNHPYPTDIATPFIIHTNFINSVQFCWYDTHRSKVKTMTIRSVKEAHNLWVLSQASELVNPYSVEGAVMKIVSDISLVPYRAYDRDYYDSSGKRFSRWKEESPAQYTSEFTVLRIAELYIDTNIHERFKRSWGKYYSEKPRESLNCLDYVFFIRDKHNKLTVRAHPEEWHYEKKMLNSYLFDTQLIAVQFLGIHVPKSLSERFTMKSELSQGYANVRNLVELNMETEALNNLNTPILEHLSDEFIRWVVAEEVKGKSKIERFELNYRELSQEGLEDALSKYQ